MRKSQKFLISAICAVAVLSVAALAYAQEPVTTTQSKFGNSPFNPSVTVQQQKLEARATVAADLLDSDLDGITDYDETSFYNSDPYNARSAGGSLTDGQLLLQGKNPETGALINFEDPRTTGQVVQNIFSVTSVSLAATATTEESDGKLLTVTGKAPVNSYVTLYIFSTPIVVTVKASDTGDWQYTLDQELDDGQHQIYLASVNNAGKIVAKSNAIPFAQEAGAAALGIGGGSSSTQTTSQNWLILIGSIILLILIVAAIIIAGLRSKKVTSGETTIDSEKTPEQPDIVEPQQSNENIESSQE